MHVRLKLQKTELKKKKKILYTILFYPIFHFDNPSHPLACNSLSSWLAAVPASLYQQHSEKTAK